MEGYRSLLLWTTAGAQSETEAHPQLVLLLPVLFLYRFLLLVFPRGFDKACVISTGSPRKTCLVTLGLISSKHLVAKVCSGEDRAGGGMVGRRYELP